MHGIVEILLLKKFVVENCEFNVNDVDRIGLCVLLFLLLAASAMHRRNVSTELRDCVSI